MNLVSSACVACTCAASAEDLAAASFWIAALAEAMPVVNLVSSAWVACT